MPLRGEWGHFRDGHHDNKRNTNNVHPNMANENTSTNNKEFDEKQQRYKKNNEYFEKNNLNNDVKSSNQNKYYKNQQYKSNENYHPETGPPNDKRSIPRNMRRGMNKNRGPTFRFERAKEFCPRLLDRQAETDPGCTFEDCSFIHDLADYNSSKLPNLGDECYVFNTRGHCPRGVTCRYGSKHVTESGLNIVDKELYENWMSDPKKQTTNTLKTEVQEKLRKKVYDFKEADKVVSMYGRDSGRGKEDTVNGESANGIGPVLDFDTIKMRREEKKKIDWSGKLYLSPLTTVGNLPFRRICKEFGADVTCGEMALATSLLQGKPGEWALTKRHGSEDLFGVQICGSKPNVMARCAQLLKEHTSVDFVDINCGCPIDLIYRQGAGSGLLNRKKVLYSIVKSMSSVLDVPLTVKTRTGVYTNKNVAHTMMSELAQAGADLITVHGRTKEQRYCKLADWDYIENCAKLASPIPVIGNGDILSFEDYNLARERSPSIASTMIGRGALFKPWIFTEIKEQRHWDISSQERFDILRKFTNYGLEHWGSDTKGVESTRRFLLEWLSFLCRYVPVGLLDSPQKMNIRPPKVEFRDELEALMASSNCADWIKISETLLGPVPAGFNFLPKHKANAWG